jgi:hypothetical protein
MNSVKMKDLRETLCRTMASLPLDCSDEDVRKQLDLHFHVATEVSSSLGDEEGITPLMVACDKGNVAVLEYLLNKHSVHSQLIGKPMDPSKDERNTAMHHAAMSGCSPAISSLNQMGESALALGAARNSHGDTPLMMAASSGHGEFFKTWYQMAIQEKGSTIKAVCQIIQAKNGSQDTCLSLACCHGHVDMVEFLLACETALDAEQVDKCKTSLQRMETALRSNPALMEQHKNQLEHVRQCVNKLETELAQRVEATTKELLEAEETSNQATKKSIKKKKPRRKKEIRHTVDNRDVESSSGQPQPDEEKSACVHLTTLADGKVGVRVQGTNDTPAQHVVSASLPPAQSPDEMFRQRFQGVSTEYDAVMNALCLDVSMLLYTPHGMSLNLSPSQLDAVRGILEKQLGAVQEARTIQNRMHRPSNNAGT